MSVHVQFTLRLSVLAVCLAFARAQICSSIDFTGCGGDSPHVPQDRYTVFLPSLASDVPILCAGRWSPDGFTTDGCATDASTYTEAACISGVAPTTSPGDVANICAEWFRGCCSEDATLSPTNAPSSAPSSTPTTSPTGVPSTTPTAAPSTTPSTSPTKFPSPGPTDAPFTLAPTKAQVGFFDVEENIYIVAGAGGGGLLVAVAAILLIRRGRRSGGGGGSLVADSKQGDNKEVKRTDIFDWEKHIDKKSGEVYFFNPKTGESRWDPPPIQNTNL